MQLGARHYAPALGRWTQQDPKVMPFDPVQANRYSYAACNPANNVDPSGTSCTRAVLLEGAAVATYYGGFFTGNPFAVAAGFFGGLAGVEYLIDECVDNTTQSYGTPTP